MNENNKLTGAHEDQIAKTREFIQELSRVQDLYYETLKTELNFLSAKGEEFLFDYIFNSGEEITFEEYLDKFNVTDIYKP